MKSNQSLQKQDEKLQNVLYNDACVIIEQAKIVAYKSVDEILIKRNWLLGMRIQHEVLKDQRAEYGEQVIKTLAKDLTEKYGQGFQKRNLYHFVDFYVKFCDIFVVKCNEFEKDTIVNSLRSQSSAGDIFHLLMPKSSIRLSWTHYRIILQESDAEARAWYENEAANEMWGTRTLQRNVSTQYYHRLLKSQNKEVVRNEMKEKTLSLQDKLEYPVKMYDELIRPEGHNPTIGILLCADTDEDVAHYSVLNGSDQLYAAKYLTFLPTKEELRREIEQQKEFYRLKCESGFDL